MAEARIYRRGKLATQSGRSRADQWVLEYAPLAQQRPDPLMGWVGGQDTLEQVSLAFPSEEAARAHAERLGLSVEVVPATERRLIIKSYADNFR